MALPWTGTTTLQAEPGALATGGQISPVANAPGSDVLAEIVRRYGTPTYAYDIARLRDQVVKLRSFLPPAVDILYSLKADASLGCCGGLADCVLGAEVAPAGELAIAQASGFSPGRI